MIILNIWKLDFHSSAVHIMFGFFYCFLSCKNYFETNHQWYGCLVTYLTSVFCWRCLFLMPLKGVMCDIFLRLLLHLHEKGWHLKYQDQVWSTKLLIMIKWKTGDCWFTKHMIFSNTIQLLSHQRMD